MKPFFRITALTLGILFLAGAAVAWIDFFKYGHAISDPGLKQAAGWSLTSLMFLAFGLRGRRSHRKGRPDTGQSETGTPLK